MSAITQPERTVTPPPPDNPYYYGWRETYETLPDGTTKRVLLPLNLEDALHPREEDFIVESDLHDYWCMYLTGIFRAIFAAQPLVLVLSDTPIYWDHPEISHHSSDNAVILGLKTRKVEYPSFDVVEEGVRPQQIIEVVSPNTRKNDVETKLRQYHELRIPIYIIADRTRIGGPWSLKGYEWKPACYVPMRTDERGRLWLDVVGLWFAAEGTRLICYDGKTDEEIGDYTAVSRQVEEEKARAEEEKAHAEEEKARAKEEKARADSEQARANAEAARADREQNARQEAEKKLKELEAELARLRGE